MPAFIGLPGAREKTEIGRGLFERSEFRSPRRRAKREAGIPDNQRATFLGNFFAAGKKLQNTVILTTAGRKNLPQSERYCIRSLTYVRDDIIAILRCKVPKNLR